METSGKPGLTTMSARERYAPYIAGLVERERAQRRANRQRAERAMEAARAAAQLLRERYGVTRVRVFGSVLHPERFHERSDVDAAVFTALKHDLERFFEFLDEAGRAEVDESEG